LSKTLINWDDFLKVDIRVGTIIKAEKFTKAKNPSYIIYVDFGELGIKKSAAQITKNYNCDYLIGQQITAVINFPKKQIANIQSEFLTLGAINNELDDVILIQPSTRTRNGAKIC
tara:strand:+ start:383 stop:727 length:345 start_codon:yes stop_codon:yes gene_type:complete